MCARASGGMPGPLSVTVTPTSSSLHQAVIRHLAARPGVLDRVLDEVPERLVESLRICLGLAGLALHLEPEPLRGRQRAKRIGRGLGRLEQVDARREQLEPALVHPREREQVVDGTAHPVDLLAGAFEHLAAQWPGGRRPSG